MIKQKLVLTLMLIIVNITFSDVSNYSYRIKGMGSSVIDFTHDSYSDVFYNPAYIANINGLQLYTNLSNLGGNVPTPMLSNELSLLQNSMYPSNLVGFLGRWKFLSGGAFYVTEGFAANIELDNSGTNESPYYDWSDDTTYLSKEKYSGKEQMGFHFGGKQILGIGTINLFGFRIGLMAKFKTYNLGTDFESQYHHEEFNNNILTDNHTSTYNGEFGTKGTFMGLIVGTLIGGENTELSVSAGLQPGGAGFTSTFFDDYISSPYYYSNDYYHYENDSDGNYHKDKDLSNLHYKLIGSDLFAKARLSKKVGDFTHTSLFGKVSTSVFPITITDEYETKHEVNRPNATYQDWDGSTSTSYGYHELDKEKSKENGSGSVNLFSIAGGLGFDHVFESGTLIVFGIKGNFIHLGSKITKDGKITTQTYQQLYNDPSETDYGYIRTIDYKNTFTMNISANILYLEIPTAIETPITKKLLFRLGSNQVIPVYGNGKFETQFENKPNEITTEYTHGNNAGTTVYETDEFSDYSKDDMKASISSTNFNFSSYHTGLGYQINENIVLDVLHYSNLTNLSTWLLSCTINF